MTVAYFFDMPQVDPTIATHVSGYIREALGPAQPEGSVFHAEGPSTTGGWWSFNVWESDQAFNQFYTDFLVPAAEQAGIEAPPYRQLEVAWDTSQMPTESSD